MPEKIQQSSLGLELFLHMWRAWEAGLPPSLRRENPWVLIRLLRSCDSPEGISQAELRKILALGQPDISKLSKRLRAVGWVEDSIPRRDGRLRLTKLTPKGKSVLDSLSSRLNNAIRSSRSDEERAQERAFSDMLDEIFDRK